MLSHADLLDARLGELPPKASFSAPSVSPSFSPPAASAAEEEAKGRKLTICA